MAIIHFVQQAGLYVAYGLAADTKPATMPDNCMFIETDTALMYVSASNAWVIKTTGANLSLSDVTTNDANTSMHGFLPKLGGGTTNFLRADGAWAAPSGGAGDMILDSTQTVSGLKTFLAAMFGLRNVANTFTAFFTNTITANRTYTLKDADGTLAFTTDITGTNSGTNTGDQTISDATITTTDITTNNATTSKHGFLQKLPGGTTTFLRADGTFAAPASGSFAVTESEVDFGTAPTKSKTFTVTDALITASHKIMVTPSGNVATGRTGDDYEFDSLSFAAKAGTGQFSLYTVCNSGSLVGKRKIFYTYS